MTAEEARALLASGQGSEGQLSEANKLYYGSGGAYSTNPSVQASQAVGGSQAGANPMLSFNAQYRQDLPEGYNQQQYATTDTANQLAQYLGGQTVQTQNAPGSPIGPPPQNMISMGSGDPFNAGLVAQIYSMYPKNVADQIMMAQMASSGVGNNYNMVGANQNRSATESQFNANVPGGQSYLGQGQFPYLPSNNPIGAGGIWTNPETFTANYNPSNPQLYTGFTNGQLPRLNQANPGTGPTFAQTPYSRAVAASQGVSQTPVTSGINNPTTNGPAFNGITQGNYTTQARSANPLVNLPGNTGGSMNSISQMLNAVNNLRTQFARPATKPASSTLGRRMYYPTFG